MTVFSVARPDIHSFLANLPTTVSWAGPVRGPTHDGDQRGRLCFSADSAGHSTFAENAPDHNYGGDTSKCRFPLPIFSVRAPAYGGH